MMSICRVDPAESHRPWQCDIDLLCFPNLFYEIRDKMGLNNLVYSASAHFCSKDVFSSYYIKRSTQFSNQMISFIIKHLNLFIVQKVSV